MAFNTDITSRHPSEFETKIPDLRNVVNLRTVLGVVLGIIMVTTPGLKYWALVGINFLINGRLIAARLMGTEYRN